VRSSALEADRLPQPSGPFPLSCWPLLPPSCEIRQLLVHVYPGGSKCPGAERITVFYGRRGRPVKKPRFMPAALAHQWARKLQAQRLGTVSVL